MSEDEPGAAAAPAKPYVVLARKYRPQTFDDLIGQEAMVQTLRNAFASGRIAQGYMLTGVRGVGKTTTARILARALNYETDTVSAPTVDMPVLGRHCTEIIESRHPDVFEMDAASNTGVDNMREIIENARYRPIMARAKVFIIDEVHMLSKGAFNALLKTLEEPPEHVKFIFATTEIRKVPVTVLSRCQRFDLRRVDVPTLGRHLLRIAANEGANPDAEAVTFIARAAGGSVRDGLSLLDQALAMGPGKAGPARPGSARASGTGARDAAPEVTVADVRAMLGLADRARIFDLLDRVLAGDAAGALAATAALHRDGADPSEILSGLAACVHAASRAKAAGADASGNELSAEERRRAVALAERLSVPILARAWQMLLKGIEEVPRAPDPLAAAEMVLIRLAFTSDLPSPDDIIRTLGGQQTRRRPSEGSGGAPVASESGSGAKPRASAGLPSVGDDSPPWEDEEEGFALGEPAGADHVETEPDGLGEVDEALLPGSAVPSTPLLLRSFDDVIALAGRRRDAKLKIHLEEHVSLVKFDEGAGSIDLFLLPGAPKELANELREKLNKWTARRWVVVLSKARGEPTRGETRRESEARELAALKAHPAVAAVIEQFPDARMTIRRTGSVSEDEAGTG
ncbi:MAG: DNA polymerase III subunit gamma/tau [Hyphomicrobium sp.]